MFGVRKKSGSGHGAQSTYRPFENSGPVTSNSAVLYRHRSLMSHETTLAGKNLKSKGAPFQSIPAKKTKQDQLTLAFRSSWQRVAPTVALPTLGENSA